MLFVLLTWMLIFTIFYVTGFSVINLINKISEDKDLPFSFDEYFFTGFLIISLFVSFMSIFIPVGNKVLSLFSFSSIILIVINYKGLSGAIVKDFKLLSSLSNFDLGLLAFMVLFILTFIVHPITLGDTESYHAQSIQWIRKYAVVPGLGNIHGRLAFNSMFFIISGLFTFQLRDVLIFPVIGLSFIVLGLKLFLLYKKEILSGQTWKGIFYIGLILISLPMLIYDLNSASPDIICTILVLYAFIFILDIKDIYHEISSTHLIIFNLIIFSCITFKLSSVFLVSALVLVMDKEPGKRIILMFAIGFLVLLPFLIRNYYLSGYLLYPLPQIDIFNPDWKIPLSEVRDMKSEIEGFAKIPDIPYNEVIRMNIQDWIDPWFKSLMMLQKELLVINLVSLVIFFVMLVRKEFFLAKIQIVIFLNLVFWLLMAPDPRFAYGFIFAGVSLTIAYVVKTISVKIKPLLKYHSFILAFILLIFVYYRADYPKRILFQPSRWVIPASFGTVETELHYSNFEYRVPVPEGGCFNVEIPCVPFPLKCVVLRGESLQDGFRVENI